MESKNLGISHLECGGATNRMWYVHIYRSPGAAPILPLESLPVGRDMACFLDTKIQGLPCPEPIQIIGAAPGAVEVRKGVYHRGRLLPLDVQNPYVVCPCIPPPN